MDVCRPWGHWRGGRQLDRFQSGHRDNHETHPQVLVWTYAFISVTKAGAKSVVWPISHSSCPSVRESSPDESRELSEQAVPSPQSQVKGQS